MRTVLAAIVVAVASAPALADGYWVRDAHGYRYWVDTGPDPVTPEFIIVLLVGVLVSVIAVVISEDEKRKLAPLRTPTRAGLPAEIATPQTVQYYDDQTARVLAYDRYLQSQAAQYRQYIETVRLGAEAHELARLIEDQRSNWHGGW